MGSFQLGLEEMSHSALEFSTLGPITLKDLLERHTCYPFWGMMTFLVMAKQSRKVTLLSYIIRGLQNEV